MSGAGYLVGRKRMNERERVADSKEGIRQRQQERADNSIDNFLDGASKTAVASAVSYAAKAVGLMPFEYYAGISESVAANVALGASFVAGVAAKEGEKTAAGLALLGSFAPEVYYAATTGDFKGAAVMAGNKIALALVGYFGGSTTRKILYK
ncbi:MAG: hypothetical protein ABIG89_00020 [Candidatus Woesearchaeota archaeon]